MFLRMKLGLALILFPFAAASLNAQAKMPVETRNAALRYWIAFADLQDPPSDPATTDLLEKTAAGEAAWDEAKLGPILDKNQVAIEKMQRATKLPDCDWGLEYSLGPRASIAYLPKARVLARLNTLYGMRLAAKGDTQKAVDTWIAGVRFSQHLARGGSLIFLISASHALMADLRALTSAVQKGALNQEPRNQVEACLKTLPDTGFDWGEAMWYEASTVQVMIQDFKSPSRVTIYYQELLGSPAPANFTIPSAADVAAFYKLMGAVEAALRLAPAEAQDKLKTLQDSVKTLHSLFQTTTPNLLRINGVRTQVQTSRQALLQALSAR